MHRSVRLALRTAFMQRRQLSLWTLVCALVQLRLCSAPATPPVVADKEDERATVRQNTKAYFEAAEQRRKEREAKRAQLSGFVQSRKGLQNFSGDAFWRMYWKLHGSGALSSGDDGPGADSEWYSVGSAPVRPWLLTALDGFRLPRAELRILHLGCGLSGLTEGLLEDGFVNLTNVDLSREAVGTLKRRVGSKGGAYIVADARNLSTLKTGSFDAALEKGLFDALLGSKDPVEPVISEVVRLLAPGGLLCSISSNVKEINGTTELAWGEKLSGPLAKAFANVERTELPREAGLAERAAEGWAVYPQQSPVYGYIARSASASPPRRAEEL